MLYFFSSPKPVHIKYADNLLFTFAYTTFKKGDAKFSKFFIDKIVNEIDCSKKNIMIDSGAFTVAFSDFHGTPHKIINKENYVEFLQKLLSDYAKYFNNVYFINLDKITLGYRVSENEEDCKESFENCSFILNEIGKEYINNFIPVWHDVDSFEWLIKYIEAGYTYLALSCHANGDKALVYRKCIETLKKDYGIDVDKYKFHGLGISAPRRIIGSNLYSIDSSSHTRINYQVISNQYKNSTMRLYNAAQFIDKKITRNSELFFKNFLEDYEKIIKSK